MASAADANKIIRGNGNIFDKVVDDDADDTLYEKVVKVTKVYIFAKHPVGPGNRTFERFHNDFRPSTTRTITTRSKLGWI